MVISNYLYFVILTTKMSNNIFFWKNDYKIQNFSEFSKNVLYVKQLAGANHGAKFQIDT